MFDTLAEYGLQCKPQMACDDGYALVMAPRRVLAANLAKLMAHAAESRRPDLASQNALAIYCTHRGNKIGQTTVGRIMRAEVNAEIDTIEAVARAFGLQAWQMLVPGLDPKAHPKVLSRADAEKQRIIEDAWRKLEAHQGPEDDGGRPGIPIAVDGGSHRQDAARRPSRRRRKEAKA